MSSASTRFEAIGTLCRRPSALLIPLAPLVLLVFVGLVFGAALRAAVIRRRPAAPADELDLDQPVIAEPATLVTRGFAVVRPTSRRILGGSAAILGGVLVAAGMAGGTYAFLNAQATIPAVTVSSGNLAITVQYGSTAAGTTTAIPTTAWATMLPGDVVGQQFTVANTGSASAAMTGRLSATTAWDIRMVAGACPTGQLTSAPLTTTAVSYGTLAAGTSTVVCVQATLPAGTAAATENTTAPFSILLDAKQVAS